MACVWHCLVLRTLENLPSTHFLNSGHKRISLDGQGEVVAVPRRVAGVAAGTVIRCRPILLCRAYPDERNQAPLQGGLIPSCLHTDGRSATHPVGSLVTKASPPTNVSPPPLKVLSKAPRVVG